MNLSMNATGVTIRNRQTGDLFAVHDQCLAALQAMSPEAWDPFSGGFVVIGPTFGPVTCAYKDCQHSTLTPRWRVTHDGVEVAVLDTEDQAFAWLLRHQGQSVAYATTWGGYAITKDPA